MVQLGNAFSTSSVASRGQSDTSTCVYWSVKKVLEGNAKEIGETYLSLFHPLYRESLTASPPEQTVVACTYCAGALLQPYMAGS